VQVGFQDNRHTPAVKGFDDHFRALADRESRRVEQRPKLRGSAGPSLRAASARHCASQCRQTLSTSWSKKRSWIMAIAACY
jgi:hypothetical protein